MARSSHCTVTSRRLVGALAAAVAFGVLTVPSAEADPQDPNAVVVAQDCAADTGTIVVVHPGTGKALWDVTTEVVSKSPSYLIKSIHHDVYVNGTAVGTFTYQFGQKVGLGEVFTCSYVERFTAPNGDQVEIYGISDKVRL